MMVRYEIFQFIFISIYKITLKQMLRSLSFMTPQSSKKGTANTTLQTTGDRKYKSYASSLRQSRKQDRKKKTTNLLNDLIQLMEGKNQFTDEGIRKVHITNQELKQELKSVDLKKETKVDKNYDIAQNQKLNIKIKNNNTLMKKCRQLEQFNRKMLMPKEQIIKENEILKMELYRRQQNGLIDELRQLRKQNKILKEEAQFLLFKKNKK